MATNPLFVQRLESIEARYNEIDRLLTQVEIASDFQRAAELARERATLQGTVALYQDYKKVLAELAQAEEMQSSSADPDLQAMAAEEAQGLVARRDDLEAQLLTALLPKDPADENDVIVEIRAGTGGDEAALFVSDLYRMYTRYAQNRRWQVEVLSSSETGIGGMKEIVFGVKGRGAYSRLKHERGVHRVQRVPATEASGRIHTSTATVVVLPEVEDVDVAVDPKDIRIDIFHSGGPGGQNVNKVSSAVRITHIPTGIVAVSQEDRSQHKNRARAMSILRARLYDIEQQKKEEEMSQARRAMVGQGERSEKGRTYNFPQNRVTDHRINVSIHSLDRFLEGDLDPMIEALIEAERKRQLEEGLD